MTTDNALPVIAIVGRPNVGKSTLFNALTRGNSALVAEHSGMTRDRQFGAGRVGPRPYILIDTGGLSGGEDDLAELISKQALLAVRQADEVIFLADGLEGLTGLDEQIVQQLRGFNLPIHLVINKAENRAPELIAAEFQSLGFAQCHTISAVHRRGVTKLMDHVLAAHPAPESTAPLQTEPKSIRVALIGRPNVGKSTLINRILGEERQVTSEIPGTTRDSIAAPFTRDGQAYTLVDTAGIRRRGKVYEHIEKLSVIKSLQAIEDAHVVLLLFDAREGITDQDSHLLGHVLESGRALVVAINKWDGMTPEQKEYTRTTLQRKLHFLDFVKLHFISALHGTGVGNLFASLRQCHRAAYLQVPTPRLNDWLQQALQEHSPPLVHGRRIKLRYMHQGGQNPPCFILHGNQAESLPDSYQRYLTNRLRQAFGLYGTPIRLEMRTSDNPYKNRVNKLTPRQIHKRKRMMQHVKGN